MVCVGTFGNSSPCRPLDVHTKSLNRRCAAPHGRPVRRGASSFAKYRSRIQRRAQVLDFASLEGPESGNERIRFESASRASPKAATRAASASRTGLLVRTPRRIAIVEHDMSAARQASDEAKRRKDSRLLSNSATSGWVSPPGQRDNEACRRTPQSVEWLFDDAGSCARCGRARKSLRCSPRR